MSETYTKLFGSITASTVWAEDNETRIVWVTMLAMCDRYGYVGASVPGLAHLARVSVEATEKALEKFLSPDPHSRSKEHDGRRIEVVDRGWNLLNYERFRDMRDEEARKEYERRRKQQQRAKAKKASVPDSPANVPHVPGSPAMSAQAEADAEAEAEAEADAKAYADAKNSEKEQRAAPRRKPNGTSPSGVDRVLAAYSTAMQWRWGELPTLNPWTRKSVGDLLRSPPGDRQPEHWVAHVCNGVRRYVAGGDAWTLDQRHPIAHFLKYPDRFLPSHDTPPEDLEDPIPAEPSSAAGGSDGST